MRILRWDVLVTGTLVVCALITTGMLVRRELTPEQPAPKRSSPEFIEDWKAALQVGVTLGRSDAPVHIVEFADFQCPYCASYHSELKPLRRQYADQLAITFVHYPLAIHSYAEAAAQAAECASQQGLFASMQDSLYADQQSFGKKSWTEFAQAAGVRELQRFDVCMADKPVDRIRQGRDLGAGQFRINGTPTVVINGWKLPGTPSSSELESMIAAVLEGRDPIEDRPWWSLR